MKSSLTVASGQSVPTYGDSPCECVGLMNVIGLVLLMPKREAKAGGTKNQRT